MRSVPFHSGLRPILAAGLLAAAAAGSAGCRHRSEIPDPGIPYASSTASEKLSTFVFKEEGRLYLMTVGVNATRFHDQDPFIPLTVVLVNKTTKPLQLHRESFTLVEPVSGARYGLAGVEEVRRQGKMSYDAQLMDLDHLATKLDIYQRIPANFFPGAGTGVIHDNLELHQFQYMLNNIYFPRPEGELLGRTFELHVEGRGLEEPIFVVFTVPEK
ncbi:MAG TPA: hypothetical protein VJV23_12535 [Candidatus Polarisedimenticolia bacterium]|nr:hypothetical protein [Candidatus Polarisedimenticolia bacterium]